MSVENLESLLTPALWGAVASVITGIITYKTASKKSSAELTSQQYEFVDKQIKTLLESYSGEMDSLREEIRLITAENKKLTSEVMHWRLENQKLTEEISSLRSELSERFKK